MKKTNSKGSPKLTAQEQAIEKGLAGGRYRSIANSKQAVKKYQQQARETLSKTRSITIRLAEKDLHKVKAMAAEKGLPYQTFIRSLLHQQVAKNYSNRK